MGEDTGIMGGGNTYITRIISISKQLLARDATEDSGDTNRSLNRYRKAFKTLSGTYLAQIVTILTRLITTPLVIHYLGNERYGLMMSATSVFFFFGYMDFGLGIGIQNRVSTAYGKKEYSVASKYVSSGFVFYLILALSLMLLSFILIPFLPLAQILKVHSPLAKVEIFPTVLVLSVTVSLDLIAAYAQRLCDALQQGYLTRIALIGSRVLSLVLILAGIYLRVGLPVLVAFYILPTISTISAFGVLTKRYYWMRPRRDAIDLSILRHIIGTGMHGLGAIIAYSAMLSIIPLIISNRLGAALVISYAVANQIVMLITTSLGSISTPFWPAITEAISAGDIRWVVTAFKRFVSISVTLALCCSLAFLCFGRWVIKMWTHSSAAVPDFSLLLSMCLFLILLVINANFSTMLNGLTRFRGQAIYGSIITVSTLLCAYFLGARFGVAGISWTMTVGFFIRCSCLTIELLMVRRTVFAPANLPPERVILGNAG